jgi:glucokinase
VVAQARGATNQTGGAEGLWAALIAVIDEVQAGCASDQAIEVCGVGSAGPMTPFGEEVSPLNVPVWRGFPLRRRLSDHLGLPVFVDGDCKALALGEGWLGAARGHRNFMAMVVSTGVGGGLVIDGRLIDGEQGNAGHIGHVVVEPGGRPCVCGSRGCLEAEISGPSIRTATGVAPEAATPETIQRAGSLLGRAVALSVSLLDLRLVTVGGSVALGFGDPFFDAAQAELERTACLDFAKGVRIVPAGLGADAPIIGAAAVGFAGLDKS